MKHKEPKREIGIVKFFGGFNKKKACKLDYGFLTPIIEYEDESDIYIHKSAVCEGSEIVKNDVVTFVRAKTKSGYRAINVMKLEDDTKFRLFINSANIEDWKNLRGALTTFSGKYEHKAFLKTKEILSSMITDEIANNKCYVLTLLNTKDDSKRLYDFFKERYKIANDYRKVFEEDKQLCEKYGENDWFQNTYIAHLPVNVLYNLGSTKIWDCLSRSKIFVIFRMHMQQNVDEYWEWDKRQLYNHRTWIDYVPVAIINKHRSLWNRLPENKVKELLLMHMEQEFNEYWEWDKEQLCKHSEMLDSLPIKIIHKTPKIWALLRDRQVKELVKYHTIHDSINAWDREQLLNNPELFVDEVELLRKLDIELRENYWQKCYQNNINEDLANRELIEVEVKKRNICNLYHFTQADNLDNILKYGLLPRTTLIKNGIKSIFNDYSRYDQCENSLCTSIEFPNYMMFYKRRITDLNTKWAVLELDAKILYEFNCAFCWENASSTIISVIDIEKRKKYESFKELFENRTPPYPQRSDSLISSYPTHPQAEVLVFSQIPNRFIKRIYFENQDIAEEYIQKSQRLYEFCIDSKIYASEFFFKPRCDWRVWQEYYNKIRGNYGY